MENKDASAAPAPDQKDEGKCCSKGRCCGCKALAAIALLALGAVGGFFAGRHCAATCAVPAASAPAK